MSDNVASLTAEDWFTTGRRGKLAVVDTRRFPDGLVIHVGDHVRIDGDDYKVNGIEQSRKLTDPPQLSPTVGLRVTAWTEKL